MRLRRHAQQLACSPKVSEAHGADRCDLSLPGRKRGTAVRSGAVRVQGIQTAAAIFWAQKAITDYRDGGGETRILVDFHSAPTGRSNFFIYNEEFSTTTALYTEIRALLADIQSLNGDFVPLDGNVARTVQGERVRGWGFTALQTHGLTVESSGNDVTYGPHNGEQMTPERLLALGEAVGRGIREPGRTRFEPAVGESDALGVTFHLLDAADDHGLPGQRG